jgi:hydrogenase maturation protease
MRVETIELNNVMYPYESQPCLKTLVLGIGNTLLGDDGAGVRIVRQVSQQIHSCDVTFKETSAAGLNLLDVILGYDRLIVVDAILCAEADTGKVFRLSPDEVDSSGSSVSLHSCGLDAALKLAGKLYQGQVPRQTAVIAVGIREVDQVSETLSPKVEAALHTAAGLLTAEILRSPAQNIPRSPSSLIGA